MQKKQPPEELSKIQLAFLATKDQRNLEVSVLQASTHVLMMVDSVQDPQALFERYDQSFFIASLLYLLINFPRTYSLSIF
jgi:hypothetical protein